MIIKYAKRIIGNIETTGVCASLENLARELTKQAGIHG